MKIKVVNSDKFTENNNVPSADDFTNTEHEVYATWKNKVIGKKTYLILIKLSNGRELFVWCKEDSSIITLETGQNDNWVTTDKFIFETYIERLKLKRIQCPLWMIQEKTFFYDTIMNTDRALETFSNNKKES